MKRGIIRKIDNLGRIVLPKEMRDAVGVKPGDKLEVFADENGFEVVKPLDLCSWCGRGEKKFSKNGKNICLKCVKEITSWL